MSDADCIVINSLITTTTNHVLVRLKGVKVLLLSLKSSHSKLAYTYRAEKKSLQNIFKQDPGRARQSS